MRVIYTAVAVAVVLFVSLILVSFGGADRGMRSVQAQEATPSPPLIDIHADRTETDVGQPVQFTLSIINRILQADMSVLLTLQVPSGWSIVGEGFADNCSSQCTASYRVLAGKQRHIEFTGRPNQVGNFTLMGNIEWFYEGEESQVYEDTKTIPITVIRGGEGTQPPLTPPPEPPETEHGTEKRGLFFNYVEGSAPVNVLDPTTLAIIGILLTVLTTWVQLVTGRK